MIFCPSQFKMSCATRYSEVPTDAWSGDPRSIRSAMTRPFYCGETVFQPVRPLSKLPDRPIVEHGEFARIQKWYAIRIVVELNNLQSLQEGLLFVEELAKVPLDGIA